MTRPITVAILGAGIGAQHLEGYRQLAQDFEVRMMCDLDPDRASSVVAGLEIGIETDLNRALADPDIDLIDICLPPRLHVPVAVQALGVGKHVICEKPIACSLAECDVLQDAVATSGKSVFAVLQYRFGHAMRQFKALVAAGLTGRAFAASLETHWNRGPDYYDAPWRGTWAGEQGGAVLGHAIHIHDLMTCLLGPVAEVTARVATRVNPIETEDCAALTFVMASGALVTSSVTLGAADDRSRLRLMFEGLTIESGASPYHPMSGSWTFRARDPYRQPDIDAVLSGVAASPAGFAGLLDAVAKSLRSELGEPVTLSDARASIELVTAIYASAQTGVTQALPVAKSSPFYAGWRVREAV